MIGVDWTTVRLFLHVLAACIWVGGQLTLAALVPTLGSLRPDVPGAAARQFNRVAWTAFGVLVLTGLWNAVAEREELRGAYAATFAAKVGVVLLSGLAAYGHTRMQTPRRIAALGALSGLSALTALFLGIVLAG